MKKHYQYIIIGGIAVLLIYLYLHKRAILSARDLGPGGGGGGVSMGNMLQQKAQKCLQMTNNNFELCGQMTFPL